MGDQGLAAMLWKKIRTLDFDNIEVACLSLGTMFLSIAIGNQVDFYDTYHIFTCYIVALFVVSTISIVQGLYQMCVDYTTPPVKKKYVPSHKMIAHFYQFIEQDSYDISKEAPAEWLEEWNAMDVKDQVLQFTKMWKQADANRDGGLNEDEYCAFMRLENQFLFEQTGWSHPMGDDYSRLTYKMITSYFPDPTGVTRDSQLKFQKCCSFVREIMENKRDLNNNPFGKPSEECLNHFRGFVEALETAYTAEAPPVYQRKFDLRQPKDFPKVSFFEQADQNKDGGLNLEEWLAFTKLINETDRAYIGYAEKYDEELMRRGFQVVECWSPHSTGARWETVCAWRACHWQIRREFEARLKQEAKNEKYI